MAVIETPPETVAAASEQAPDTARPQPTGLAAVLGSGDHKVIGRLYVATSLLLGLLVVVLGEAFAVEALAGETLDVFAADTVFQFFTLFRVGTVFLLAMPLVIGLALIVVPLQVGARSVAFPRAAAASYWGWLTGASLLLASYAMNGGPGGGSEAGVNLWIAALGLIVISVLLASVSLATTVLALRHTGLSLSRVPLFAWSVAIAAILWVLTLPVLLGLLALVYVDHRHGGSSYGSNAEIYQRILWVLRNPQIYVVAIPVLGFAADVLSTTARARIAPRSAAQGAIAAFGVFSFGAFLAGTAGNTSPYGTWVVIAIGLGAVLPVLAILGLAADLFRRGSFRLNAGALYAVSALLLLLLGVGTGALGSFPRFETTNTIFDLGVTHAVVLAAVVASLGGLHWWATKVGRQAATEGLGRLAPLVLLVGALAVVIPDLVSALAGDATEKRLDWTGGIEGLNVIVVIGLAVFALGMVLAVASLLPLLKAGTDVPADPWEGQSLEWLAPSPPPFDNFATELPVVTSAEPLTDQREEK